ncbi:hypothetical protein G6F24_015401 [Rhizopus arrhizus]|nr:hypothetical protein G6F24_015401 [Rhizopus arrhizus]
MAVNDPFVMKAWAAEQKVPDGLLMLSDGNAELTRVLGLELDASASGMGIRSRRFALYVVDGVVRAAWIEQPGQFEVSSAAYVLEHLPTRLPTARGSGQPCPASQPKPPRPPRRYPASATARPCVTVPGASSRMVRSPTATAPTARW